MLAYTDFDIAGSSHEEVNVEPDIFQRHVMALKERGVFFLNTSGIITVWNPGAESVHGFSCDEIIGSHFSGLYPDSDIKLGKPFYEMKLAEINGVFEAEGLRLRKDGTAFFAHEIITSLRDEKGALLAFSKVVHDITRSRQKAIEVRETVRLLNEAQHLARMGSWTWNIQSGLSWSRELYLLVGRDEQYPVPDMMAFSEYFSTTSWDTLSNSMENCLVNNQFGEFECQLIRSDGSRFWAHCRIEPLLDSDFRTIGLRGTIQDINERKEKDKIHNENEMLRHYSEQLKSSFLANISHELKTPLQGILGLSELLKGGLAGDLSDDQREYVTGIFNSGQHLLFLINDLLDFAKMESHEMTLNLTNVDVSSVLSVSISIIKNMTTDRNLVIESQTEDNLGMIILDKPRVQQIIFHLLSNAVKFSGKSGKIVLSARRTGRPENGKASYNKVSDDTNAAAIFWEPSDSISSEFLEINISDTGIGVPAEYMPLMFQPFSQLDDTMARKFPGTGLGLALVKQIVELHGGAVRAQSQVDKGSCFTVWLPVREAKEK